MPAKITYLDNLKIYLTALVIAHHVLVAYGGNGSWYYVEKTTVFGALVAMTMIVATNQAFFMGFFFLMSALFTEPSYDKKGATRFINDRLKRLGIPLLFYTLILGPVMNYLVFYFGHDRHVSFAAYLDHYDDWIDFGVLWFVMALLFFSFVFVIIKQNSDPLPKSKWNAPSNPIIILFALGLGVVSFVVRIFFSVGWTVPFLGWQLGHFPQYISLFVIGIIATRNKWLELLDWKQGKKLWPVALLLIVLGLPIMFVLKEATNSDLSFFTGGLHWQSLYYCLWEQLTGISIIVVLLTYAKEKWNSTTIFLQRMSRASFAVYIIHPFFVIGITLILRSVPIDPAFKALICIPVAVTITFLCASYLVKVPVVNKVV